MSLRPSVFRKAARLVAPSDELERTGDYYSEFACHCIEGAAPSKEHWCGKPPERLFFEAVFCRGRFTFRDNAAGEAHISIAQAYPLRIMALELAALLVEDGLTLEDLP